MYVCMYTYDAYVYVCVYTYILGFKCLCIYMHTYTHTHTYKQRSLHTTHIHTCNHEYIHIHTNIKKRKYIQMLLALSCIGRVARRHPHLLGSIEPHLGNILSMRWPSSMSSSHVASVNSTLKSIFLGVSLRFPYILRLETLCAKCCRMRR
jgi:hypothetical protein